MKNKKPKKISEDMKRVMRQIIEDNRSAGGDAWRVHTKKEILEIFGYIPYWAKDLKAE